MQSWEKVRDCLHAQGFEPVIATNSDAYQGNIKVGKIDVRLEVRIADYNFITLPKIYILNATDILDKLCAHIVTDGSLCYADKATFVLDRYQPDRSILSVLEQTKVTLRTLLHGNPTPELLAELSAYWGGPNYLLLDDHLSLETVQLGVMTFANKHSILVAGKTPKRLKLWASTTGAKFETFSRMNVVHCKGDIVSPGGKLNFKETLAWVQNQIDPSIKLEKLIRPKSDKSPGLLIVGNNAVLGFRAKEIPVISKARKGGFRQSSIPDLWFSNAASIGIL